MKIELNFIILTGVLIIQIFILVRIGTQPHTPSVKEEPFIPGKWEEKILDSERANLEQFKWLADLEKRVDNITAVSPSISSTCPKRLPE